MKNKFIWWCVLLVSIGFLGCSHSPTKTARLSEDPDTLLQLRILETQKALESGYQRLPTNEPPSDLISDLDLDIESFNRLSPGKFEIFLFRKNNSANLKYDSTASREFYAKLKEKKISLSSLGRPRVFEMSVVAATTCKSFAQGAFKKDRASEFFVGDTGKDCAILTVLDKDLSRLDKALVRKGDVKKLGLYLDERFKVYGYRIESALDGQNEADPLNVKTNPDEHFSPIMVGFPVELPNFFRLQAELKVDFPGTEVEKFMEAPSLDQMAKDQLQKRNKAFLQGFSCSEGKTISYVNLLKESVQIGWCKGQPWPAWIETPQYMAYTQPLKIK